MVFVETEKFPPPQEKINQLNFHLTNFENTHRKI